jgi:hypothetical protein
MLICCRNSGDNSIDSLLSVLALPKQERRERTVPLQRKKRTLVRALSLKRLRFCSLLGGGKEVVHIDSLLPCPKAKKRSRSQYVPTSRARASMVVRTGLRSRSLSHCIAMYTLPRAAQGLEWWEDEKSRSGRKGERLTETAVELIDMVCLGFDDDDVEKVVM